MGPKDPGDHAPIDQSWDVSDARGSVDLDTDLQEKVDAPDNDRSNARLAAETDEALANFRNDAAKANDRTVAGLGVMTPAPSPVLKTSPIDYPPDLSPRAFNSRTPRPRDTKPPVLREPGKGPVTLERASELSQPERSPFDLVMEGLGTTPRPKVEDNHDLSRFVSTFSGDTPPPVEIENPLGTAMEPVQRKARKRKQWLAIGAIAATAIVGTAVGMKAAGGSEAPKPAASEVAAAEPSIPTPAPPPPAEVAAAKPAEVAPPAAEAAPPPSETPPSEPTVPAEPAAKVELVATTAKNDNVVAMKTPTSKKPSTTTKTTTAKKTTTATKTTSTKKTATTKKTTATKKTATAKKTTAAKKTTTTKKTTKPPAKKTTKKKN